MTERTKWRLTKISDMLNVAFNETVENELVVAARLLVIRELLYSIEDEQAWLLLSKQLQSLF